MSNYTPEQFRDLMQQVSERTCGAYSKRDEFLKDLENLMEAYPLDRRIKYDFRGESIQENARSNSSQA